MKHKTPLQNIEQKLKESYFEAVHYGYNELADKINATEVELFKLERKAVMSELSKTLEECYYKASKNGLDRIAKAIGIAEEVITDEGLEIGEEYY